MEKAGGNGRVKCIYCNADTNKLFSPVGIIFKGSGFYTTDYKSGSGKKGSPAGKPSEESKEQPQDQKTKPEAKNKEKSSSEDVKAKK